MTKTIIDASAWIEYFLGSKRGEKIKEILEEDNELITLPITFAEIISYFVRVKIDINIATNNIKALSKLINDSEFAQSAGEIHANIKSKNQKFSLADAFIVASAKKLNANILTCDNDFRGIKEAIIIN